MESVSSQSAESSRPAAPEPRPILVAGRGYQCNLQIADKLYQAADILSAQGADPFRIAAYRRAADSLSACDQDLMAIVATGGREAIEAIHDVGVAIASAVAEMLATGRWAFLDHLKGMAEPDKLFRAVPGIGPALSRRLCEALHVNTLEALEIAAHDGRLEQVSGFGRRRVEMVRAALARMLARVRRTPRPSPKNRRSTCCWTSTANIANGRVPAI